MDLDPFSRDYRPALTPVDLALAPWRRLVQYRGVDLRLFTQRTDESFSGLVVPPVALDMEFFEDR